MQMRNRYGELRATIERIVEKTVFAGVVSRFQFVSEPQKFERGRELSKN